MLKFIFLNEKNDNIELKMASLRHQSSGFTMMDGGAWGPNTLEMKDMGLSGQGWKEISEVETRVVGVGVNTIGLGVRVRMEMKEMSKVGKKMGGGCATWFHVDGYLVVLISNLSHVVVLVSNLTSTSGCSWLMDQWCLGFAHVKDLKTFFFFLKNQCV